MVLYVDVGDYDETPMPVVAKDLAYSFEYSVWSDFAETSTSVPGLLCIKPLPTQDGAKVPCKLLQSEQGCVMLVRSKDENGTFYIVIEGADIKILQRITGTDRAVAQGVVVLKPTKPA